MAEIIGVAQANDQRRDLLVHGSQMKVFDNTDNLALSLPNGQRLTDRVFIVEHRRGCFIYDIPITVGGEVPVEIPARQELELHSPDEVVAGGGNGKHGVVIRVFARPDHVIADIAADMNGPVLDHCHVDDTGYPCGFRAKYGILCFECTFGRNIDEVIAVKAEIHVLDVMDLAGHDDGADDQDDRQNELEDD